MASTRPDVPLLAMGLHGFGDTAESARQATALVVGDAVRIVAPAGPIDAGEGRGWFDPVDAAMGDVELELAREVLHRTLSEAVSELGRPADTSREPVAVGVIAVSQGAATIASLLGHGLLPVASDGWTVSWLVLFSAFAVDPAGTAGDGSRTSPDLAALSVFSDAGLDDDVVPEWFTGGVEAWLRECGARVQVRRGARPHVPDVAAFAAAREWLVNESTTRRSPPSTSPCRDG